MVDGTYYFEDKTDTRHVGGDHNSPLGPDGMFAVKPYMGADGKMHDAVGIHAGRQNKGGWEHWTAGCIRTEEAAIAKIKDTVRDDPLTTLTVDGLSRRVTFRVTLRWQNSKTESNGRRQTKADEDTKSIGIKRLRESGPSLLGFLDARQKTPSLSADLRSPSACTTLG